MADTIESLNEQIRYLRQPVNRVLAIEYDARHAAVLRRRKEELRTAIRKRDAMLQEAQPQDTQKWPFPPPPDVFGGGNLGDRLRVYHAAQARTVPSSSFVEPDPLLPPPAPKQAIPQPQRPMSTGAKVGVGIGAAGVAAGLGVGIWQAVRAHRKKHGGGVDWRLHGGGRSGLAAAALAAHTDLDARFQRNHPSLAASVQGGGLTAYHESLAGGAWYNNWNDFTTGVSNTANDIRTGFDDLGNRMKNNAIDDEHRLAAGWNSAKDKVANAVDDLAQRVGLGSPGSAAVNALNDFSTRTREQGIGVAVKEAARTIHDGIAADFAALDEKIKNEFANPDTVLGQAWHGLKMVGEATADQFTDPGSILRTVVLPAIAAAAPIVLAAVPGAGPLLAGACYTAMALGLVSGVTGAVQGTLAAEKAQDESEIEAAESTRANAAYEEQKQAADEERMDAYARHYAQQYGHQGGPPNEAGDEAGDDVGDEAGDDAGAQPAMNGLFGGTPTGPAASLGGPLLPSAPLPSPPGAADGYVHVDEPPRGTVDPDAPDWASVLRAMRTHEQEGLYMSQSLLS